MLCIQSASTRWAADRAIETYGEWGHLYPRPLECMQVRWAE